MIKLLILDMLTYVDIFPCDSTFRVWKIVRVAICCPWFSKMSRSLLRSSNGAAFWCGPNIYILQMGPASVGSKWWLTNGFRDTPWYPYDTLFSDKPSWVASWYTSDSKLPKWCQNHPNTIIKHHPKPSLNDAKIMPHLDPQVTLRTKQVLQLWKLFWFQIGFDAIQPANLKLNERRDMSCRSNPNISIWQHLTLSEHVWTCLKTLLLIWP